MLPTIETQCFAWLQKLLDKDAPGLKPSLDKTEAALFRGDERPLVRQSRKMERIQGAISGGFDALGGEDILDSIQGLVKSQARYSRKQAETSGWSLAPVPDVRDETVARFAAARFRSTFRSLRPLLEEQAPLTLVSEGEDDPSMLPSRLSRTRLDLDDEARAFALGLIENWVVDPSNVRLLRIGLDLWPAEEVLSRVLSLLLQHVKPGGARKASRRVAWYCLSEIFRAGATETGFVEDQEKLPEGLDISAYRALLAHEGKVLLENTESSLPWYLKQQILLFLSANSPHVAPVFRLGTNPELKEYRALICFLKGEPQNSTDREFATHAILGRRSYLSSTKALDHVKKHLNSRRINFIAERDPSFALELFLDSPDLLDLVGTRLKSDLCLSPFSKREGWISLAELVLTNKNKLRNELNLLQFALAFLEQLSLHKNLESITPNHVMLKFSEGGNVSNCEILAFKQSHVDSSIYEPPTWCETDERWRYQLGYLLRFILSAQCDFTKSVQRVHWKENLLIYRTPQSHWLQRLNGLHSGYSAFGADWLPITDWTEHLLYVLLSWPGCRAAVFHNWGELNPIMLKIRITARISELSDLQGPLSKVLMLPLPAPWPERPTQERPLRVCVVQSVIPTLSDFVEDDITMSAPAIRRKHRNHISAALAAVEKMLDLRETHKSQSNRLDWLILPELSVHPDDVETHLVPFARAHKTIILAGLTYQEVFAGEPLINSALWIVPVWSHERGLEVLRRRQGKFHLARGERERNIPVEILQGFRPCQWLIGYEWHTNGVDRPLWLTGSVCYDATDIKLAADLRSRSDIFAVPAFNQDVNTFDQMALALHYHMFQMVIIANNGTYGGSNAYAPYYVSHIRQIFHLHGQPQASMAFLEIDNIGEFLRRGEQITEGSPVWKEVPAGFVSEHRSN